MAKTDKEEIFYVGIRDPIEIRRSLLESSKDMVHSLQRFERFKSVRKEKHESIQELKELMGHIKKLVTQLKSVLPENDLRVELGKEKQKYTAKKSQVTTQKVKKEKAPKVKEVKERITPKEMSELEKLEAELSAIEGKLSEIV